MNTLNSSLAIVNSTGPLGSMAGQESVDLALAMATFGQDVSVFFIDDGVFQLIDTINSDLLDLKDFTKTFGAFSFYDIDDVYVCRYSLSKRGIQAHQLKGEPKIMDANDINRRLNHVHTVVTL